MEVLEILGEGIFDWLYRDRYNECVELFKKIFKTEPDEVSYNQQGKVKAVKVIDNEKALKIVKMVYPDAKKGEIILEVVESYTNIQVRKAFSLNGYDFHEFNIGSYFAMFACWIDANHRAFITIRPLDES